jgi:HK97 family phage major capsid protein
MAAGLAKLKETVNNQPLRQPDVVAALQKFRTTNIPSGSPAASDVFVGDFTQLMIGVRTNFTLEVSRQAADATNSAFTNLQVWIRCYMRADVQLAHPEAFAVAVDVSE